MVSKYLSKEKTYAGSHKSLQNMEKNKSVGITLHPHHERIGSSYLAKNVELQKKFISPKHKLKSNFPRNLWHVFPLLLAVTVKEKRSEKQKEKYRKTKSAGDHIIFASF